MITPFLVAPFSHIKPLSRICRYEVTSLRKFWFVQSEQCAFKSSVSKKIIQSKHIYKPVGPYSQAVKAGNTLYLSGLLGMDASGTLVCGGAEAQMRKVLDNLVCVLEAGDSSLEHVLKVTIMLNNIQDFTVINKVYSEYFTENYPARSTFQVGKLPVNAEVEMEVIALSGDLEMSSCPC